MNFRFARAEDSAALLHIYGQYIDTPITFEYALPTEREFAERIRSICAEYPYLVCEEDGKVIGYAYAHRYRERAAYQWDAELSVYLDDAHVSRGVGRRLYQLLFAILRLQNIKKVYGCVTLPNPKSEALHTALGFSYIGTYHRVGYKNGQWHDVCWFEKEITPHEENPAPPIPIHELPAECLTQLLE